MIKLDTGNQVTRLEIIDTIGGREYVNIHISDLVLAFQDNGRTLKIFVTNNLNSITGGINALC